MQSPTVPRSRRAVPTLLSVVLLVVWVLLSAAPAQAAARSSASTSSTESPTADPEKTAQGPAILIGTAGLRWDDITAETTPNLWGMLERGSSATITIRSVRSVACPVDGWLALSAGRRAGDERADTGTICRAVDSPTVSGETASVPRWSAYLAQAASGNFDAEPGLLGTTLAEHSVPFTAVGPGAAIALADRAGQLHGTYVARPDDDGALTQTVAEALTSARLLVIDAGSLRDPANLPATDPESLGAPRAEQAAALDARVGAVLAAAPETSTVMVASLADSGSTPHLQLLAATGPTPEGSSTFTSYGPALLGDTATRQIGLVQVTDLMPTVLQLVGITPDGDLPGATILPQPGSPGTLSDRRQRLLDLDAAATHIQRLVPTFFNGLVAAEILLYGAGALALRKEWGGIEGRRRVLAVLRRVAVVFAAVPVSTFLANLVPWWRTDHQLPAIVAAVCIGVAAIATLALLGPWRDRRLGPLGFIGGITATVLAIDVATGSTLQISSLMGLQPLVGGRFYGLGNVEFALFASGALMLATSLADAALQADRRRLAVVTVLLIGVIAVVIDGLPGLGSDFGGPPAMIPAFLMLALFVGGVRITWQRIAVIGTVTLAIVALLCIVDYLRPPADRTHLGRFVQTLLEGGAGQVIGRKLLQNWEILTGSWLTLLVPFGAVFIAVILMRPVAWGVLPLQRTYEAAPTLKHGLISLCVMLAIGFAVNDSGTVVPAIGAVLVIPLLIAASVRTLELGDQETGRNAAGELSGRSPS